MGADLQDLYEVLYHIEGCAAMLIGAFGCLSGFQFGKYFFDRCLIWT